MELRPYIGLLRRRWLAVLACVLTGMAVSFLVINNTPKLYTSSVRLFIDIPAARGVGDALQAAQLSGTRLQSYSQIAVSGTARNAVTQRLHLAEAPKVSATPVPNTLILQITATQSSPQVAQQVADATGAAFTDLIAQLEQGQPAPTQPRVIDSPTLNRTPVRPQPTKDLSLGLLVGLVVGIGLAVGLESFDRSIKDPNEAEVLVGSPLLGTVPRRRSGRADSLATDGDDGSTTSEAFRSLRTSVRFIDVDSTLKSILVTSPMPGEGKTTVAAHLAIAMAEAGQRVVLVDADLRRGRLSTLFDLDNESGVSSVIIRQADLPNTLRLWRSNLLVLTSGPTPPNPSELLGSVSATETLEYLTANADIVVIDAPPVLPVADAVVLSTQVDGVIMVLRVGRTRRERAAEATRRLTVVGANIVGCVMNGTSAAASYGTYSGYHYEPLSRKWDLRRRGPSEPQGSGATSEPAPGS